MKYSFAWAALLIICLPNILFTQEVFNDSFFPDLQWRNTGPFRGGRVNAVAGLPQHPLLYFMGTTGGGLWKTEDGGISWDNISDGFFRSGSVGAIAIAPSDPNIIYVGMGEHAVRGVMTSHGDGVYKSMDAGKTWLPLGLQDSRHISGIQIHPQNPNIVFVAVQGALFGDSEERGVYRSLDGGKTWEQVLYINASTGASDLSLDLHNPRILYAGMWDHRRSPWTIRSGGTGSGLYKSTDGGVNWQKLSEGLPNNMGKTAIKVSPANPDLVYANIEAEQGGVFRSTDGGEHWEQVNNQRNTIARAWYYIEIFPDPKDEETVYVLNAPLLKSTDGGRSFQPISNPHSDQHDLWINPNNTGNMILGNDGGACITYNGGKSWSSQYNQPTGQFYRVITDHRFPYYIYGGQQDHSTVALPSRTNGAGIGARDWYPVSGGESAFIAFDPDHPQLIFGGSYQGIISVLDTETGIEKNIMAYPELSLGSAPKDLKYRFNWNAPIVVQPQNPSILYHAGQVVFRSNNNGISWEVISPDLTRNEPSKQGAGGRPFTNEGAGGENYNTISYLACSPHEAGVMWVGSDDGLVHLTRNNGKTWENVTPPNLGEVLINSIEISPHNPATAYVVATKYKWNQLQPMLYFTDDYGAHWQKIVTGIDRESFVRVVREDRIRPGLLYAGTESGMYISYNKGINWHPFQLNLPICPITDIAIENNDLIVATSGRAFWILDDLSPIQQLDVKKRNQIAILPPRPAVRFWADMPSEKPYGIGQNPSNGLVIDYYLPEAIENATLALEILDEYGNILRSYTNVADSVYKKYEGGPNAKILLPAHRGFNRFYWDMRREALPGIDGVFVLGDYSGSHVTPGHYQLRLITPQGVLIEPCQIVEDPRLHFTPTDYQEQQEVLLNIETTIREIHTKVSLIRNVKQQLALLNENLKKQECHKELTDIGEEILLDIEGWEAQLIQNKQQTHQDVINFPNQLSAELLHLKELIDGPDPRLTLGVRQKWEELTAQWGEYSRQLRQIMDEDIASFNEMYRQLSIPAILLPNGAQ